MFVNEKQNSGAQGTSPGSRLAESTSSRQGVPKIETGKQSVLPVGRTSQQKSIVHVTQDGSSKAFR